MGTQGPKKPNWLVLGAFGGSVRGEGVPLEREPPTRVRSNAESVVKEPV